MDKANETVFELKSILHEFGFKTNRVAVEIYGRMYYMNEVQIRALQVLAKRKAAYSGEAFKEFVNNVIVYSSHFKEEATHTLIFRKDGCFENDFKPGFMDVNSKLIFEIL